MNHEDAPAAAAPVADAPQPRPLRVVHVTPAASRLGGGVFSYLVDLVDALAEVGVENDVVAVADDHNAADRPAGMRLHALQRRGPVPFYHAPQAESVISRLAAEGDVIHAHGGTRTLLLSAVRKAARRAGRGVLLSPHGTLYPWLLARDRTRKWLVERLYDRRNLRSVTALHATCQQEAGYIRAYGLDQPVHVVPAGVRLAPSGDAAAARRRYGFADERVCLFLGIMDRKKGLLRLVEAWRRVWGARREWRLVIAGPDIRGHEAEVRAAIAAAELPEDAVSLVGAVYGSDKADLLAAAELFVLPTDWENFGIVVGEALGAGVPVITTSHTPWDWLASERAGWHVPATADALATAIAEATGQSPAQLAAMGQAGRKVVGQRYGWRAVALQMREVYERLCVRRG